MSINSSLIKLANKIDTDGVSEVTPDYKNPNNSVEKSLERIADNYESGGGGGSSLPAVTPEDEGKVLTVDSEGEWVAGGGGGTGGGVLVVNCNADTGALDKTWNEINNATFAVIKTTPTSDTASFTYISGVQHIQIGMGVEYQIITYAFDDIGEPILFKTDNADGYPVMD